MTVAAAPDVGLRIARGFTLPLDLVTEATAIVATRGAGKSSTSVVVAEEGNRLGVQVVAIDRTGVYWGLRSNASGDGPGLPFYVLGGPHGDAPLEPTAGKLIADLVVDSGHSFVLDLSDFSKSNAVKFAADFLERLYDRKARSRTTLLLVIDEAHFYAPQTPRGGFKGEAAKLMGAMEDIVGLGRSRGLGVVLTTQRTQALNKAVLDLIETLLVMRMLSPRARDAVQDWIREKHEDDREGVIATLESLPTGTAWVWSPLRGILQKIAVRRIKTFDSYATPKPGETRVEPTVRKELDLDALGVEIQATAERAKENDPAELRRRVRDLEERLAAAKAVPARDEQAAARIADLEATVADLEAREPETVEVPAVSEEALAAAREVVQAVGALYRQVEALPAFLDERVAPLAAALERASESRPAVPARVSSTPRRAPPAPTEIHLRVPPPAVRPEPRATAENGASGGASNVKLKAGAVRILEALASHHPMRMTRAQVATLARLKRSGGTFGSYWSSVKVAGLIDENGDGAALTEAGLAYIGADAREPASPEEVLEMWHGRLKAGARAMLDELLRHRGEWITRSELAAAAGLEPSGGTFGSYLSTLRTAGLAEVDGGHVRVSETVLLGAR